MRKVILLGLVASLFIFISGMKTEANLIVNGSFETPVVNGLWMPVPINQTGWNVTAFPGLIEYQTSSLFGPARDGNQYVELDYNAGNGNPWMYQFFDTIAGQNYGVNFSISPRQNVESNMLTLGIAHSLTDPELVFQQYDAGSGLGLTGTFWTDISYIFTADSTYSGIGFRDFGPDDGLGSFLDNVSVTMAPVPEPGTLLLLGIGIVGLAFYRRKRSSC